MAEFRQNIDCSYCGYKNTVRVITTQTKYSRTVKVKKCNNCNEQMGVKSVLNSKN